MPLSPLRFLHFQDVGAYGRLVHLQPMTWHEDWPVIGVNKDGDGCGEPVQTYRKPDVGSTYPRCTPQESNEFDHFTLHPQWQWQANINEKWAWYAGDKGFMRLYSYPVPADYKKLWDVANILLQKTPAPQFTATMELTFTPDKRYTGERTGLVVMGLDYAGLLLEKCDNGIFLSQVSCKEAKQGTPETMNATVQLTDMPASEAAKVAKATDTDRTTVWLRARFTDTGKKIQKSEGGHDQLILCHFSYSLDGKKYQPLGEPFQLREGQWIGAKAGTFCTRPSIKRNDGGWADVDWFRISK